MLLQTDPTVIYGLGEKFDGNLRKRDLDADTPYNTYTRAGLPPTPIALPGAGGARGDAAPAASDDLYFVARGDGTSQFSATLAEHNRAVPGTSSRAGAEHATRGRFITLEGIDGAGKSTHVGGRAERCCRRAASTWSPTREPGGTPARRGAARAAAARADDARAPRRCSCSRRAREHVEQVIEPALARGDWVLCDRFTDATYAYQGGGRGVPRGAVAALEALGACRTASRT